ncbi:hypothetical protein JAAARDRAFT_107356, partial [Jaapia argillacea MUCL 33604]
YLKWANTHGFKSMLPKDAAARIKAAKEAAAKQSTLDGHLEELPQPEHIIPYTNETFKKAAVEWLIATDQPIQAFEHPKFIKMINVASRAKNRIKL